jgi:PIN domain nuclease of toxin-antitoxin system
VGKIEVILVDTHVVGWLALDPDRLSKAAKTAIDEARKGGGGLAISDISLFELAVLFRKKRITLDISLEHFLAEVEARFLVLPMTSGICVRALGFAADYPKDPADRIIVATALAEGLSLLTANREIRRSKAVTTIW